MFAPREAKYKFRYHDMTFYVIEDDPDSEQLRVRTVHGTFDFPKDELRRSLESGEADIGCEDKLLNLKSEQLTHET